MADLRKAIRQHVPAAVQKRLRPRRFHAFCIGPMKTGTLSLGRMLNDCYKSAHEPEPEALARRIERPPADPAGFLRARDRRLWLEMESSHLLVHFVEDLVELFPDALFVFTVRDCYTWMASYVNHHLGHDDTKDFWKRMRRLHFGPREGFDPLERELEELGLFTVDGYLSYWQWHNARVLECVPAERLLVLRTAEISNRSEDLADFLGVPRNTISLKKSHSNRARKDSGVIERLDPDYLRQRAEALCEPMMQRLFPEIQGPRQAFDSWRKR